MDVSLVSKLLCGFSLLCATATFAQPVTGSPGTSGLDTPLIVPSTPVSAPPATTNTATTPADPQPTPAMQPATAPQPAPAFSARRIFIRGFEPQWGLGVTIIPAQGMWNGYNPISYFQGGVSFDVGFRVAPRLGFVISVGGVGSDAVGWNGSSISELLVSGEMRVFLHNTHRNPNRFHVAPYLAFGFAYNFAMLDQWSEFGNYNSDQASYLGGMAGMGVEFRGKNFSLGLDIRGIVQGSVRPSFGANIEGNTYLDLFRGGVRFGISGTYYFDIHQNQRT